MNHNGGLVHGLPERTRFKSEKIQSVEIVHAVNAEAVRANRITPGEDDIHAGHPRERFESRPYTLVHIEGNGARHLDLQLRAHGSRGAKARIYLSQVKVSESLTPNRCARISQKAFGKTKTRLHLPEKDRVSSTADRSTKLVRIA